MVNLTDKMRIIQMHLSGKSNREIAGDLGLNRKTTDKYVARYRAAQETITADGAPPDAVRSAAESICSEPEYGKRKSPPRKWNAEMDDFLDRILASEEEKRKRLRTSKQRLTKTRMHALMLAEGFDIGLMTVCAKINGKCAEVRSESPPIPSMWIFSLFMMFATEDWAQGWRLHRSSTRPSANDMLLVVAAAALPSTGSGRFRRKWTPISL